MAWARTLVEFSLVAPVELLMTHLTFSDAMRHNTKRHVPVESSEIMLYPGQLALVSQIGSAGIYTVPPFRQTENWGVEVRIRNQYWILRQSSLVSGL